MQDQRCFEITVDSVKNAIARAQDPKYPFNTKKALHFADLRHEARKFYTAEIAKQPFTAVNIVIYKQPFASTQLQIRPRQLYNYASGELIKRVLLWCSEQQAMNIQGDRTVQLVFSNRSALNCTLLGEYYEQLFSVVPEVAPLINKHFSKKQVLALPHSKRAGLQIADAVASSFGKFFETDSYGQTERSYVTCLVPVIYRAPDANAGVVLIPAFDEEGLIMPDVQTEYNLLEKLKEKAGIGPKDPTVDQTAVVRDPGKPEDDHR